jgi:hypothetical protein
MCLSPWSAAHHEGYRRAGGCAVMWTPMFGHHDDRTPTQGYEATREAAMTAFAAFTSTLETCRQELAGIVLGCGSKDRANAIPRSREGTSDLYRFAFWQFSHYERTAVLEHLCSSICRVSHCYTCDKQGQDSKFYLPERMTTAIDDRLLTKPYHGPHHKNICRSASP